MNIKLIKKYKKEFDHLVEGGNVLMGKRDYSNGTVKWYPSISNPFIESSESIVIVINDEFVKYRKALAEGKIVQYNFSMPPTNYNNYPTAWNDMDPSIGILSDRAHPGQYRIKPDKHKFKIDDWVKIYFSNGESSDLHYIKQVEHYEEDCIQCTDGSNVYFKNTKIEPWIPETNELYWDLYNNHLCKCTSVMKSKSGEQTVFGVTLLPTKLTQECLNEVSCLLSTCEPYLGERPKWINLKDLK